MATGTSKDYSEVLELYESVVEAMPGVERKGATMPYTSVNGHMFSLLTKEGDLALRLPKAAREQFLEDFETELCVQYGSVMKEYVIVTDRLLDDAEALTKYFEMSFDYTSSLKPK